MDDMALLIRAARLPAFGVLSAVIVACAEDPAPPSVNQFVEDRILLEATMVRCAENRSESKYTVECVNAREAADRIATEEAAAQRKELEAKSEQKRQSLRRAQEAAAEARQRAEEAERRRQDAELTGQYPADAEASGSADSAAGDQDTDDPTPDRPRSDN